MEPRDQARRAYERGRVGVAAGRGAPAILFGLGAWGLANGAGTDLVCSLVIAVIGAGLVYRGGPAGRAVPAGLVAGLLPFALPLIVRGQLCPMGGRCDEWCLAACGLGGLAAGAWLGWRSTQEPRGTVWLLAGGALSVACGAMGCGMVGLTGVAGMAIGVAAAGAAVRGAWALLRACQAA